VCLLHLPCQAAPSAQAGTGGPSSDEEAQKKQAQAGMSSHLEEDKEAGSWTQLWGLYKVMGVPWALLALAGIVMGTVAVYLWQLVSAV